MAFIDLCLALYEAQNSNPDLKEKLVMYFDGEKDPRNLMIIFSVLLVVMTEWDISTFAQVSLVNQFKFNVATVQFSKSLMIATHYRYGD